MRFRATASKPLLSLFSSPDSSHENLLFVPQGLSYPGAQSSRSLAQHFFKDQVGPSGMDYLNQDPREALLKYSEKVDADPMFTAAYKETQPDDGKDRFDYGEERREKRAKPYFY